MKDGNWPRPSAIPAGSSCPADQPAPPFTGTRYCRPQRSADPSRGAARVCELPGGRGPAAPVAALVSAAGSSAVGTGGRVAMGMGATSGPVRAGPRSGPGFRVLGPVEAVDGRGTVLDLGAPRTRALLAALLVHRGTVLSVDRLVDLLWDGEPPATARTMVHGAVAALRRALASSVPAAGALD